MVKLRWWVTRTSRMWLRIVDEEQLLAGHPQVDDVAVGARQVREERERIAARPVDQHGAQRRLRAGRTRPARCVAEAACTVEA